MSILLTLPQTLIEEVLLNLDVSDIVNCGSASERFREIALSETLWRRLVHKAWGTVTNPQLWLAEDALGYFELVKCKFAYPGTFRQALE